MERKELGKIQSATFGLGGYQDAQIGFWLSFGGDSWGVSGSGGGAWAMELSAHCKWTEADRQHELASAAMKLAKTLEQAKKRQVQDLVGVPVEVTFDGNILKDWRILTEVL
jgi:hypothetical protein